MTFPVDASATPVERLEAALSALSVLQSLYCLDKEFEPSEETATLLEAFADGEDPSTLLSVTNLSFLQAVLRVSLDEGVAGGDVSAESESKEYTVALQLRFSLSSTSDAASGFSVQVDPPNWMSRKQYESLSESFQAELIALQPEDADDEVAYVSKAVEIIKKQAEVMLLQIQTVAYDNSSGSNAASAQSLVRIWMHLPSLSTKSKRDDLVSYAPNYSITGIVHAGKPALVILEAPTSNDVEAYLSDIKTYSWADIPSSHKKISERLREENLRPEDRVFQDMQEITEEINVKGMKGVRGNRGDLGALRDWLIAKGLSGDNLSTVLGTNLQSQ